MTTVEKTGAVLTLNDVKAMRTCDRVSISHNGKSYCGAGTIRCIKILEKKGPFDDEQREHIIECESTVRCYLIDDSLATYNGDVEFKCHELLYNYDSSVTEIGSLAAILKVGDELSLFWQGSHNGYTKAHGLHMDELAIMVKRGEKKLKFMMSQNVSPDNTARMIQRRGY